MAVRDFWDVCKKEVNLGSRIHIMGIKTELNTLCKECWGVAEKILSTSTSNLLTDP